MTAGGRATPHLQWSCAIDIGWLEEHLDWLYERMFKDSLDGARSWYIFPAMFRAGDRFEKRIKSDTPEGERLRKKLSPFFNKPSPGIEGKDKAVKHSDRELLVAKKDQGQHLDDSFACFDLDEYMESLEETFSAWSELSPGLGEFMMTRMRSLVRRSFERDIEDGDL